VRVGSVYQKVPSSGLKGVDFLADREKKFRGLKLTGPGAGESCTPVGLTLKFRRLEGGSGALAGLGNGAGWARIGSPWKRTPARRNRKSGNARASAPRPVPEAASLDALVYSCAGARLARLAPCGW